MYPTWKLKQHSTFSKRLVLSPDLLLGLVVVDEVTSPSTHRFERTRTYFNAKSLKETKITTPTMQQFFMENGYRVASGGGKVFHGTPGKVGDALFRRPIDPKPPKGNDIFNAMKAPNDGYALDASDEEMGDYKVASWANEQWNTVNLVRAASADNPH